MRHLPRLMLFLKKPTSILHSQTPVPQPHERDLAFGCGAWLRAPCNGCSRELKASPAAPLTHLRSHHCWFSARAVWRAVLRAAACAAASLQVPAPHPPPAPRHALLRQPPCRGAWRSRAAASARRMAVAAAATRFAVGAEQGFCAAAPLLRASTRSNARRSRRSCRAWRNIARCTQAHSPPPTHPHRRRSRRRARALVQRRRRGRAARAGGGLPPGRGRHRQQVRPRGGGVDVM